MPWVCLTLGSIAGGFSRYFAADFIAKKWGTAFPMGTLLVNLSGCFLIGIFSALANDRFVLGTNGRLLLMTGFCGAYTTFSTFALETSNLVTGQEFFYALLNVVVSVCAGFILFRIGSALGRII